MTAGRGRHGVRVHDPELTEDEPDRESMRAAGRGSAGGAVARRPSTDQLRLRRRIRERSQATPRTASGGDSSMSVNDQTEVGLLQAMAAAPDLATQQKLASILEAYRSDRAAEARESRSLDFAAARVEALYPTNPALHTTATGASDWLGDAVPEEHDRTEMAQRMAASASLWYRGVAEPVRADDEEFAIQARGMAGIQASAYGTESEVAARAFLDHVAHLHGRRVVAEQAPPGSALPVGVGNDETFDESLFGPAGPADRETEPADSPSLAEGDAPEGDQAQQVVNPAAYDAHDAGPGAGTRPSTDYLDGAQTPPGYGTGMTTMTSLIARQALRVLAEGEQTGVVDQPRGSSDVDQLTPSQQEGDEPEGDVPATGQPPVELRPHDAGPGNGPATDYLDGQQYAFARLRPLAAVARSIPQNSLLAMPDTAVPFAQALLRLRTVADRVGQVPGRTVVEALLRTAGVHLPPSVVAELRAHLDPRVAGDLPPWLKDEGGDEDKDAGKDEDDGKDDSDEGSDDSDNSDDSDGEDSDDDPDQDEGDSDDDEDPDEDDDRDEKKTSARRLASVESPGASYDPRPEYRHNGSHRYYDEGYEHGRSGQEYKGYGSSGKAMSYGKGYRHGRQDAGLKWGSVQQQAVFRAQVQAGLLRQNG